MKTFSNIKPESKPDISIILPTYNRCDIVKRAINSALSQTFKTFEIIVVDDCSTDNTKQEVLSISDKRIHYIQHNRNKGGSAARNTGINQSKGKYITFLDDDDEYPEDRLTSLISVLESRPECGYALSKMLLNMDDGAPLVPSSNPLPFT